MDNCRVELRPELCPPEVGPGRIAELCGAIDNIAELLERGEQDQAEAAIAAFNADTGHHCVPGDFLGYSASRSVEDFAVEVARPAWPKVADTTREELVEIVRRIQAVDDDIDYYLLLLRTNVVHPGVSDLIFWPPPELVGASAEAIVDAALSYKLIAL